MDPEVKLNQYRRDQNIHNSSRRNAFVAVWINVPWTAFSRRLMNLSFGFIYEARIPKHSFISENKMIYSTKLKWPNIPTGSIHFFWFQFVFLLSSGQTDQPDNHRTYTGQNPDSGPRTWTAEPRTWTVLSTNVCLCMPNYVCQNHSRIVFVVSESASW